MPTALDKYEVAEGEPQLVQVWVQDTANQTQGSWQVVPRLRCEQLRNTVQPYTGISNAVLTYDYGKIDRNDGNGYIYYGPLGSTSSALHPIFGIADGLALEFLHKFIRVLVINASTGTVEARWVGCVTGIEDRDFKQPRPTETLHDTVQSFGTQVIQCSGPEWLLNRKQVTGSVIVDDAGRQKSISRALPFNAVSRVPGGETIVPNRQPGVLPNFAGGESPQTWTSQDIVEYLQLHFAPDSLDTDTISPFESPTFTWTLANQSILSRHEPSLDVHGQTFMQIFNQIASPRRFASWSVSYSGASDVAFGTFQINFNSASSTAISIGTRVIAPANPNTIALNTSGTIDGHISLTADASNSFSQVIVTGSRQGHVFSTQTASRNRTRRLKPGWSTEDEEAYNSGIPPADEQEPIATTEANNDALRSNKYREVYTRFVFDSDREFSGITPLDVYVPGLRFTRSTPLKEGWDYTTDPPTKTAGARDQPEYLPLFAMYRYLKPHEEDSEAFVMIDKAATVIRQHDIGGSAGSASIRPLEDAFGVSITPSKQAHWQAAAESVEHNPEDLTPAFDYKNDITVTGYFQEDVYTQGAWPAIPNTSTNASTLVIRLGDVAFYDTLNASTVVGIDKDGQWERSPNVDVVLRDDRQKLEDLARLAYEWYGERRYAYAISYAQLVRDVVPGMVATNIDGSSTNALITEVAWDFNNMQTNIATAYAEPDFTALASEVLR